MRATWPNSPTGGTADPRVKDLADNALTAERHWTFTTR